MKITKKLLKLIGDFNTPDTALVISGYPEKIQEEKNHGIAWYTKLSISPVAKNYNQKFVVLAEKSGNSVPEVYENGKILVLRIFNSEKIHLYPQILKWLNIFSKIKNVFVHSEFSMKGGAWNFGLIPPFLGLIKMTGRKISFFSHNVIDNIDMLSGHLNIKKGSLQARLINIALKFYYFSLSLITDEIVVLDQQLEERLSGFIDKNLIKMIPIPVKKHRKISKKIAKKYLNIKPNEKVLLYFGFVTWYKGADWIIKEFNSISKLYPKVKLVVAGGPSYSLADKPHYKQYYAQLKKISKNNKQIIMTGFIDEDKINTYFSAADIAILPYRGLMGASGCFTHALSYGTPFMVSKKMSKILNSEDFNQSLKKLNIKKEDMIFSHSQKGLTKILDSISNNSFLLKMSKVSSLFAKNRSIKELTARAFKMLYNVPKLKFNLLAYED